MFAGNCCISFEIKGLYVSIYMLVLRCSFLWHTHTNTHPVAVAVPKRCYQHAAHWLPSATPRFRGSCALKCVDCIVHDIQRVNDIKNEGGKRGKGTCCHVALTGSGNNNKKGWQVQMSNLQHCLHSVAFTWQLNWLAWGACEYPVNDIQCATGHMCAQESVSNLLMSLLALLECFLQGICSLSCAATTSLLCLCECECTCVCVCVLECLCTWSARKVLLCICHASILRSNLCGLPARCACVRVLCCGYI